MPKFLDNHAMPQPSQMTPEQMQQGMQMMQQMKEDIVAGKPDQYGVKPLNVFMGANGHAWCLTEAADADAVIKAHAVRGVGLTQDDITEVSSLV